MPDPSICVAKASEHGLKDLYGTGISVHRAV
jgi:hypothetical protein